MAEYPDFEKKCGYGSVTGIGGANCRHSFWPFVEGVMERTYSDAELEAMKPENRPKTVYEGREYDDYQATQMQRRIEREIRREKRRQTAYKAASLEEDAKNSQIRLRRLNTKYREFSKAAGLPEQRERMKVQYVDDASQARARKKFEAEKKRLLEAEKSVEKYSKIRYHKDGRIVVTDDWTGKEHVTIPKKYKPNAVVDTLSRKGKQRDRTIYGPDAIIVQQIHGGDHGQPKHHPFGKHGEHIHDYTWPQDGGKPDKPARDPTREDRIKHKDILGGDDDDD